MEFLTEQEELWARMLVEVLADQGIPTAVKPVYGAAFALKTGRQDLLQIYVPAEHLAKARDLAEALFSAAPEED